METPPPPFPQQGKNKGLPPLAWFGIGCGGLIVVAAILAGIFVVKVGTSTIKKMAEHPAKEAAEAVVAAYPDIEKISEDSKSGSITLRSKSGGGQIVTTYDEVVHGRVTLNSTPVFQGDLIKVPAWVPRYPGASGEVSTFHQELPERVHGIIAADTTDTPEAMKTYFDTEVGKLFPISSATYGSTDFNGAKSIYIGYRDGKRFLEIRAYAAKGAPLTMQTSYSEDK